MLKAVQKLHTHKDLSLITYSITINTVSAGPPYTQTTHTVCGSPKHQNNFKKSFK